MNRREMIEKIASGLRRMNTPPDFFMVYPQDEDNFEWDEETILDIPVLYCSWEYLRFKPYGDVECPFIPCFKQMPKKDESYAFGRGYLEG